MVSDGAASATDPVVIRQAKRFKGASEHQDYTPLTEQQAVRQPTEDGIAGVVAPTDDAVTDGALNDAVTDGLTDAARKLTELARTCDIWKKYEKHLDALFEPIYKRMREYKDPDQFEEDGCF